MKFLKNFRNWIYSYLFYYDTNNSINRQDRELKVVINQYTFVLFINFILISIFNLINFEIKKDVILIAFLTIYFAISPFVYKKHRTNKYVISINIVILTLIINYYCHYCGLGSGVFMYYLPLLFSITIIFNIRYDEKFLYSLLLFIIVNMYSSILFQDSSFITKSVFSRDDLKSMQLLNLSGILLNIFLIYLIMVDKRESLYILENRNILKREEILNLKNEVVRLKSSLNISDISEESLKDLLDCVQISDTVFIDKFELLFPGYLNRIKSFSAASLNLSELKYCALFKLGYTTKQIAIYTDTSIKSVESKKYRLRKKLHKASPNSSNINFEEL